ncbi:MAG: DUF2029 domain-containing protein [Beijerinckiaceae bacterium]|nr:DUF2029 domain-containing protein [Beijerinckiaceae bacterium]
MTTYQRQDVASAVGSAAPRRAQWLSPLTALLVSFAIYDAAYLVVYLARVLSSGSELPFGDFFAFWSFARFSHEMKPADIYDTARLLEFQHRIAPNFKDFYPFPYPPAFLLILWPIGFLSYAAACMAWIGSTVALFAAALWQGSREAIYVWLCLLAPFSLMALISGQNGFFSAALMIGGFKLLKHRPFVAGMVFGCLLFKPQFLLLLPAALLAAGCWRALFGLAASALMMVLASEITFGPGIWLTWAKAVPTLFQLFQTNIGKLAPFMPTVTVSLLSAGLGENIAKAVQIVVTAASLVLVIVMFRRRRHEGGSIPNLDIAAFIVAVFLATPYAFIYDMPMLGFAAVALLEHRAEQSPMRAGDLGVLLLALFLPPLVPYSHMVGVPTGPIILLFLLAVILRARWAKTASTAWKKPLATSL